MRAQPFLLLSLAFSFAACAAETKPFGFTAPEIYLSSFGSRALRTCDLNQDDRPDLLTLNNDKGRIDLYLQLTPGEEKIQGTQALQPDRWHPVLEDARFQRSSIVTGGSMYDSLCGDFNRDGATDLLVTDDQQRAIIFHGPVKTGWQPAHRVKLEELLPSSDNMILDTIRNEIVILSKNCLQTLRWDEASKTYSTAILTALHVPGKARYLRHVDVNADKRNDLLYEITDSDFNLGIHLATETGYSTVQLPLLDPPGFQFEIKSEAPFSLLSLHPRSRVIQEHQLLADPEQTAARIETGLDIQILPFPPKGNRDYEYRWADLDQDHQPELLARIPNEAEMSIVEQPGMGKGTTRSFPIPAGCEWSVIGRFTGTKQDQVLYCDTDRSYLGLSTYEDGRLQYPLYVSNQVEWVSGARIPGSSKNEQDLLLGITKQEKAYVAHVFRIEDAEGTLALKELSRLELKDLDRDPYPPQHLDVNYDGKKEFVVCTAYSHPFFLFVEGETLKRVDTAKGFSTGLLGKARPSHFIALPPWDGFPSAWLRLDDGIGQFLSLDDNGTVSIVDQINLHQKGNLSGLLPLSKDRIALLNTQRNEMEIHHRTSSGLLVFERSIRLPQLTPKSTKLRVTEEGFELWVEGSSQLTRILPRPQLFRLSSSNLFETELDGVLHSVVVPGNFNGDEHMDLAVLDPSRKHVFEFLRKDEGAWTSAMHFQIFEAAQNFQGRRGGGYQPREFSVQDLNGDDLDDLVLLIHDRILLYLQDPVPAP